MMRALLGYLPSRIQQQFRVQNLVAQGGIPRQKPAQVMGSGFAYARDYLGTQQPVFWNLSPRVGTEYNGVVPTDPATLQALLEPSRTPNPIQA